VIVLFLAAALAVSGPDCAECHPAVAASYAKTGMGRSFQTAKRLPHFPGTAVNGFSAVEQNGRYSVHRAATDDVPAMDVPIDYAIGSGDHAVSYLHRTRDNKLIELPVSWYPENGGHWGMSPGYDRTTHPGFSRNIAYRCMFCHNAYPVLDAGHGDTEGESIFPAQLPEGIDCGRCHGPGAAHAEAARQGKPAAAIRAAIVNPARLAPDRQLEVCLQCHLETTSLASFASITKFNRGVFSYIPGHPLGDYIQYFDYAPGTGHDERLELVSEAYRFRQSACFLKSQGRLTCTTCHNPHEEAALNVDKVCTTCHQPHTTTGSCVECHMPKRQAADAIHIAVTDHRIARIPAPQQSMIERHDGNTPPYKGEVVAYYPKPADPLYLAAANGRVLPSDQPEAYYRAGMFEKALDLAPDNWRYIYGAGRAKQSIPLLERALSFAPWETSILQALGAAYFLGHRPADAVLAFRQATERDPEDAMAFSNLGNVLLRTGDAAGAEKAFREAIRLRPEMPQLRDNLRSIR
jgi:hypothetical protein